MSTTTAKRGLRLKLVALVLTLALLALLLWGLLTPKSQLVQPVPAITRVAPIAETLRRPSVTSASVLDYVERDLSTTGGAFNVPVGDPSRRLPTLWLPSKTIVSDGKTEIAIEAYIAAIEPDYENSICVHLYEGRVDRGLLIDVSSPTVYEGMGPRHVARNATTGYGRIYLTPTRGRHHYALRIYSTGYNASPSASATNYVWSGHARSTVPKNFALAYLRISR